MARCPRRRGAQGIRLCSTAPVLCLANGGSWHQVATARCEPAAAADGTGAAVVACGTTCCTSADYTCYDSDNDGQSTNDACCAKGEGGAGTRAALRGAFPPLAPEWLCLGRPSGHGAALQAGTSGAGSTLRPFSRPAMPADDFDGDGTSDSMVAPGGGANGADDCCSAAESKAPSECPAAWRAAAAASCRARPGPAWPAHCCCSSPPPLHALHPGHAQPRSNWLALHPSSPRPPLLLQPCAKTQPALTRP